jgi:hypothetical protein
MPQAESVALPKRLPLVLQPENRDESTHKDAKLINAYVEKSELTGEYWIFKRPGLDQTGSTLSGTGRGVYNWLGDIYAIFGSVLYKNGVSVGTGLDTTNGVYRFSSSLGDPLRLQLGNGVKSYNYDDSAGLVEIGSTELITAGSFVAGLDYTIVTVGTTDFTLIGASANTVGIVFTATGVGSGTGTATTPNNFPSPVVKGWAYLDGTTYVMDALSSIRGCAVLNDPTDWTDILNAIEAQIEPDGGVALTKQLVYVLALGQWSTEVFYDQQNATASPLGAVQGAKVNYGCANADSVQEMDGVLFWIATNRSAAPQILMLENLKPTIVSTKAIERLMGEADLTSIYSFSLKYEGHRFYGFTMVSENLTLVYDMADKMWAQWTDENGNYWPIVSSTYNSSLGRVLQHESNGKLYTFDSEHTNDDGALITVDLYTPNFDGGVRRRKQLNIMEFIGDQTTGSTLDVRFNDWDYAPTKWSNFRRVDMSLRKPILANNGSFMRRAYHLRHRCDTRLRIQAIELQLDMGTL